MNFSLKSIRLNRVEAGKKLHFTADLFCGSGKVARITRGAESNEIKLHWLTVEAEQKVAGILAANTQLTEWIEAEIESHRIVHAIRNRIRKGVLSVYKGEVYSFQIPPEKLDEKNDVGLSVRDRLIAANAGHTLLNGLSKNDLTDVLRSHHVIAPQVAI